jgi:hypothetical protein
MCANDHTSILHAYRFDDRAGRRQKRPTIEAKETYYRSIMILISNDDHFKGEARIVSIKRNASSVLLVGARGHSTSEIIIKKLLFT